MAFQNVSVDAHSSSISSVRGNQTNINISNRPRPGLRSLLDPLPDAAYNRRGRLARCIPGTRQTGIADILRWLDNGDRPICWLHGLAGSGKSAIAQTIAEICASDNKLAASFFFLRGSGNRSKTSRFLTTIAFQLSLSLPSITSYLKMVLTSNPLIAHQSVAYQFQKLISEPVLSLRGHFTPMLVVIDALDECDEHDLIADLIAILITAFTDLRQPLRFLFTSRVEESIRRQFEVSVANPTVHILDLQDYPVDDDIRLFFQSSFATIYEGNRRLMADVPLPWPPSHIIDELVQKSSGSFIFASTLVNFVNNETGIPDNNLAIALKTHAGLDPLYKQVFASARRTPHFDRVISSISLLRNPLSITQLASLLQIENRCILHALLRIQSVVIIPGNDNQPIQFLHTSLREFLISPSRSGNIFIARADHLDIATACLTNLSISPVNEIFYEEGRIYACLNWCFHFHLGLVSQWNGEERALEPSRGVRLMSCLTDFASRSLDFWVNTLILRTTFTTSLDILDSLSRLNVPDMSQVFGCIYDRAKADWTSWLVLERSLQLRWWERGWEEERMTHIREWRSSSNQQEQ